MLFLSFSLNKNSGLSNTVAEALRFLTGVPRAAVILIVIVISGLFTEVTSNLSTASIFLPVLDSIVRSNNSFSSEINFSLLNRHVRLVFILLFSFSHALWPFLLLSCYQLVTNSTSASVKTNHSASLFLATPPNAIVFGSGAIRVIDMVRMLCNVIKESLTVLSR